VSRRSRFLAVRAQPQDDVGLADVRDVSHENLAHSGFLLIGSPHWTNSANCAARVMQQLIVDYIRHRTARKRGAGIAQDELPSDIAITTIGPSTDFEMAHGPS
jgi:hypothetical protein